MIFQRKGNRKNELVARPGEEIFELTEALDEFEVGLGQKVEEHVLLRVSVFVHETLKIENWIEDWGCTGIAKLELDS